MKTVKVHNNLKGFSSHPGHGSASKTAAQFVKQMQQQNKALFPAERATPTMGRVGTNYRG